MKLDIKKLIEETVAQIEKEKLNESEDVKKEQPEEKQPYERNTYESFEKELQEAVASLREVSIKLNDMKLRQEAHSKMIPELEERRTKHKKALEILEKSANYTNDLAEKLNRISIIQLKEIE